MHGGSSAQQELVGAANPAFKHGRYSRALPVDLGERYAEALASSDLLSLRDEVAVLEARIAELLAAAAPAREHWAAAGAAFADMRRASATGDAAAMTTAASRLDAALRAGSRSGAAWSEVAALMERKRRMARDEVRRLQALGQTITAERAMVLVAALADSVMRNVTDTAARARVRDDFARLVGTVARPGG
jgi:hypothetical protein